MNPMTLLVGSLIAISGLVGLVGCSIPSKEDGSASTRQVVIPWWSEKAYKWETVSLFSLNNLSDLEGSTAKFFLSPSASTDGKTLMGTQPRIRYFKNQDGAAVMTDELSQHLVTLYAHMERLQEMDQRLGVGDLLRKPRVVGVSTVQNSNGMNNALYSPKYDALLFLPYSGKDLPIIVNAGAVAHEHFHSLFQAIVGKDIQSKVDTMSLVSHTEDKELPAAFGMIDNETDKIMTELEERARFHSYLLRGINEGLADVWALIYTGDPNFVQKTWTKLVDRSIEPASQEISTREALRSISLRATQPGSEDTTAPYALGTQYARIVRTVYGKAANRETFAPKIITLLKDLRAEILALDDSKWLSPSTLIGLLAIKADKKSECELFLSFAQKSELDSTKYKCQQATP